MNPDPWAPANNQHHFVAYRTEEEWWDDNFPKGPADGDAFGYPGQEDATGK
jgi:hypothetical protein